MTNNLSNIELTERQANPAPPRAVSEFLDVNIQIEGGDRS
jgi:hypothetical protein